MLAGLKARWGRWQRNRALRRIEAIARENDRRLLGLHVAKASSLRTFQREPEVSGAFIWSAVILVGLLGYAIGRGGL